MKAIYTPFPRHNDKQQLILLRGDTSPWAVGTKTLAGCIMYEIKGRQFIYRRNCKDWVLGFKVSHDVVVESCSMNRVSRRSSQCHHISVRWDNRDVHVRRRAQRGAKKKKKKQPMCSVLCLIVFLIEHLWLWGFQHTARSGSDRLPPRCISDPVKALSL